MKLVLVHGFKVDDGGVKTVDTLIPFLPEHEIFQADYGWLGFFGVRVYSDTIARVIAGMAPEGSIGIGHSHGAAELIKACKFGAKFSQLILINPALDNDLEMPVGPDRIDVLHNSKDDVVIKAKYRPFHLWGDMGRVGYKGTDKRVHNHETRRLFNVKGHSAVFKRPEALANYIKKELLGTENNRQPRAD